MKIPGYELGYSFDGIGNREETTLDGLLKGTYTANELNQYTEIEAAGTPNPRVQLHDADGNLTDDSERLYTYNGENRLIEVREKSSNALIVTYHYDDQGRRYRKVTTAAAPQGAVDGLYLWDGWNNVWESNDGATTSTAVRVWGLDLSGSEQGAGGVGGLLLQRIDSDAHFFAYDGNGNVSHLVDITSGNIVASYEYGPFGEAIANTGTHANINRSQFSTKYNDEETSFLYYGYRCYIPESGRWLNRDPIEEEGGLNLYGFVSNNSVLFADRLGFAIVRTDQKMMIDVDGAPNAYGPGNIGLDYTANAGVPGNWWALVVDGNKEPILQESGDPFPGYYVSTTSLFDRSKRKENPARYVDARKVPYIVHYRSDMASGSKVGDIATVVNIKTRAVHHAIVADYRGKGDGEASMFLANLFGVNPNPRSGGTSNKDFCYIIWKGSTKKWPVNNSIIASEGERLYQEWVPKNKKEEACKCSLEVEKH